MLGFSKSCSKLSCKAAKEIYETLVRHQKGEYTEEEIEQIHENNVTPEIFISSENTILDPKCKYCDEYREGRCNGKNYDNIDCEKFHNKYDLETCKYCKFAEPIDNDNRHINCLIKKEKRNINRWCNKFHVKYEENR